MTCQLAALGQQHPPAMPVPPTRLCPQTAGPWAQQAAEGPSVLCRLSPTWCRAAAPEGRRLAGQLRAPGAPLARRRQGAPWPRPLCGGPAPSVLATPLALLRAGAGKLRWLGRVVVMVSTGAQPPAPVFIPKYIYFANQLVGFV